MARAESAAAAADFWTKTRRFMADGSWFEEATLKSCHGKTERVVSAEALPVRRG